ncbi:LacI family DNA-binding transcriptional regulator [Aureibaculum marinum]|uniref:LacI family DNA-binding transcriptional regulator n=1 Tax=Aureibaculum marinum TaxID=2487930 RepID=A0A3N4NJS5_9FLAO|nr:substrate-binding domain-containing protein [Aureibaculum marinum]RPD91769.1 LacI family DNA-binding transcriptional regulator [Aureibaculum marinum]
MGIKRIAKLANVSIGTVDRVLHKRPGVSKETEKRVLKIIKETGYSKNTTASRLKLASVKKIKFAILIPKSGSKWSYWKQPKKGVLKAIEELTELGVKADFYEFSDEATFIDKHDTIFNKNYDAIVTVPFFKKASNSLLKIADSKNIPVVFLDTEIKLDKNAHFIRQNAFKAGMVAGRLLHGLVGKDGHYFVINISNDKGIHANGKQRENGFKSFFKSIDKNVKIHTINHPVGNTFEISKEMKLKFENTNSKGIFVTNSRAHLIPPLLKKYNIKNTFVLGFDLNKENLKCLHTNEIDFIINQNPKQQGYKAIKGLYKYITEQDTSELNIDIPIDIIVKENIIDDTQIL